MSDISSQRRKGISCTEARGKLPAWIWRAIRDAERESGSDRFPATVIRDNGASFILVELGDWNEILHLERTADR